MSAPAVEPNVVPAPELRRMHIVCAYRRSVDCIGVIQQGDESKPPGHGCCSACRPLVNAEIRNWRVRG